MPDSGQGKEKAVSSSRRTDRDEPPKEFSRRATFVTKSTWVQAQWFMGWVDRAIGCISFSSRFRQVDQPELVRGGLSGEEPPQTKFLPLSPPGRSGCSLFHCARLLHPVPGFFSGSLHPKSPHGRHSRGVLLEFRGESPATFRFASLFSVLVFSPAHSLSRLIGEAHQRLCVPVSCA